MNRKEKETATPKREQQGQNEEGKNYCGLVMPISGIDDCSAEHWKHVKRILSRAITSAGLEPRMVNESEEAAIIHRNIVHNLYNDSIVVCDVSHRNPNVMLELGMRLAFGKHVVIVKDDKTAMPFDAGVIEFIPYPRDLHFPDIEAFIPKLSEKIRKTYEAAKKGDKSTFLEYFREVKAPTLEGGEMSLPEYLEREFAAVHAKINMLGQHVEFMLPFQSESKPTPVPRLSKERAFFKQLCQTYEHFCVINKFDVHDKQSVDNFVNYRELDGRTALELCNRYVPPF